MLIKRALDKVIFLNLIGMTVELLPKVFCRQSIIQYFMYYLKLSGFIPENKEIEFEQTLKFVSKQIPNTCDSFSLSKDAFNKGIYYFVSYWSGPSQLQEFEKSSTFIVLTGAFKNLGHMNENVSGQLC